MPPFGHDHFCFCQNCMHRFCVLWAEWYPHRRHRTLPKQGLCQNHRVRKCPELNVEDLLRQRGPEGSFTGVEGFCFLFSRRSSNCNKSLAAPIKLNICTRFGVVSDVTPNSFVILRYILVVPFSWHFLIPATRVEKSDHHPRRLSLLLRSCKYDVGDSLLVSV